MNASDPPQCTELLVLVRISCSQLITLFEDSTSTLLALVSVIVPLIVFRKLIPSFATSFTLDGVGISSISI